ncbi:GyrI-like domain-containing protein [Glycomyces sp. NPDC049804]|uniref:GyrI-like domain-containing protein n=1 Tax=Glycomyces sp. NPDC049804 TaxID=3154363 RepID=UPI003428EF11
MDKYDVKKAHRELYSASADDFAVVEVPEFQYLAVDGRGDPNTAESFAQALEALYGMSYTLKFTSKNELGRDYVVAPLEGLWRAEDPRAFAELRKESWEWTLLVHQPEWITEEMVAAAAASVAEKRSNPSLGLVRLLTLTEGTCVQTLHIGSYESESSTLERMHRHFMPEHGLDFNGDHHEIYLSDPRRTPEEKLRTILRQPVRRVG